MDENEILNLANLVKNTTKAFNIVDKFSLSVFTIWTDVLRITSIDKIDHKPDSNRYIAWWQHDTFSSSLSDEHIYL